MKTPRKILVISLAGIGDTIFATPLIRELRGQFPDAVIDAFVLWKGAAEVLQGNPNLNTVFQKDLLKASKVESLRYLLGLRRNSYDLSINTYPQSRLEYRLIAFLIGAKTRLSHDYQNSEFLDRWLVTKRVPQDYSRHAVCNNLSLLENLGIETKTPAKSCELFLSEQEHAWAERFLDENKLNDRWLLGIHVGSGGTKNLALRRWSIDNYVALIKKIRTSRRESAVLLFGGPEEQKAHAELKAGLGNDVLVVNSKSIRESAALIARCNGFLSVDTALMHVAAAMKVPHQVVIETPTWNSTVEPFGNRFTLVPNPAVNGRNLDFYRYDGKDIRGTESELREIMESVTVESVYSQISSILSELKSVAP